MELTDERIVFSAGHLVDVDPLDRTRLRELVRRPFTRRELHELDLEPNNPSTSRSVSGRISASPRTSRALRGRRSYGCSPPASGAWPVMRKREGSPGVDRSSGVPTIGTRDG